MRSTTYVKRPLKLFALHIKTSVVNAILKGDCSTKWKVQQGHEVYAGVIKQLA